MINLTNKIALVTGGSRGIGRATAVMLAEAGAEVIICGRDPDSLERTRREIGGRAIRCDVSKIDEIEAMMAQIDQLDILVNNAVTSTSAPFDALTDDEFRYHIDVKLMAYIRIARLALERMGEGGRIVNIGGMTARIVAPLRMTNGVVNAGVANFTKQFAGYAAGRGVTVNCVHPGYTATERIQQIFEREAKEARLSVEAIIEKRTGDIPLGKLIQPEDLAKAVLFFCSPLAEMITGQSIAVDGGSGAAIAY